MANCTDEEIDDFEHDQKESMCELKYADLLEGEDHASVMDRAAKDYEDFVLQDDEEIERHI